MEVAPENWMGVGGQRGRLFREFTERMPFVCHGLSLSIGGPSPLDETFLHRLRPFLDQHRIRCYTEHLSYCSDDGHLYDLMPIPFTQEAVRYVAARVKRVQDILSEIEFITAILEEADCDLLLDVNNIYVNSVNHRYDAIEFLQGLPGHRIAYGHIAGHDHEAEDLIVDTHGANVIAGVWQLLDKAYETFGVFPTLLERDFNIPTVAELMQEIGQIKSLQDKWQDHVSPVRRQQA